MIERIVVAYRATRRVKNDPNLFSLTIAKLPDALRNARRLHNDFQEQGHSPDKSNPCTTVYQLVELLEGMTHTAAETKEQV